MAPFAPLLAASAVAVASATIIAPAKVKVEIKGEAIRVQESGARAPDHRIVIRRDSQGRTCTITYVGY